MLELRFSGVTVTELKSKIVDFCKDWGLELDNRQGELPLGQVSARQESSALNHGVPPNGNGSLQLPHDPEESGDDLDAAVGATPPNGEVDDLIDAAPPVQAAPAAKVNYTIDHVREALRGVMQTHSSTKVREILAKYNASKVGALSKKHFEAVISDCVSVI